MPYLGSKGAIYLKRDVNNYVPATFTIADVDTANNRIGDIPRYFIAGDEVIISNPHGVPFDVAGISQQSDSPDGMGFWGGGSFTVSGSLPHQTSDSNGFYNVGDETVPFWANSAGHGLTNTVNYFINRNDMGFARFYPSQASAINNNTAAAITVFDEVWGETTVTLATMPPIMIGEAKGWNLSLDKDAVDITVLGEEFRKRVSGLISGGGKIDAIFELSNKPARDLVELATIGKVGADATVKLYLYQGENDDESVYYEADVVITNAAFNLTVDEIVASSIDFATTGEIKLRMGRSGCN